MKHLHSLTLLTCALILISMIENKHRNKHHRVKKVPFNAADLAMEYYQQNTVNNVISNHLNQSPIDADPSNFQILNGKTKENDPLMKTGIMDPRFPEAYYPHYDPSLHPKKQEKMKHYKPRPAIYEKDQKAYYRSTENTDMINSSIPKELKSVKITLGDLSDKDPSKASKEKIEEMQKQLSNLNNFIPLPKNMLKRDKGRRAYYPDPNAYYDPTKSDTEEQKRYLQNSIISMRKNLDVMEKNGGKIPLPFQIEQTKGKIYVENRRNYQAESYNKHIANMLEDETPKKKQFESQTPKAKKIPVNSKNSESYYKAPKIKAAKVQTEKEHRKISTLKGGISFSTISSNFDSNEKKEKMDDKKVFKDEMLSASNFDKNSKVQPKKITQFPVSRDQKMSYSKPKMVSSVKGNDPWDASSNQKSERVTIIDKNEKKNNKKAEKTKKTEKPKAKKAKKSNKKEVKKNEKKVEKKAEKKPEKKLDEKKEEKPKRKEKKVQKVREAKEEENLNKKDNKKEEPKRKEKKVQKVEAKKVEKKEVKKLDEKKEEKPKRKEKKVQKVKKVEAKEVKKLDEKKEEKPKRKEKKVQKVEAKKVEKLDVKKEEKPKRKEKKAKKVIVKNDAMEDKKDQRSKEEENKKEKKLEKPARKTPNTQGLKTEKVKIIHRKKQLFRKDYDFE